MPPQSEQPRGRLAGSLTRGRMADNVPPPGLALHETADPGSRTGGNYGPGPGDGGLGLAGCGFCVGEDGGGLVLAFRGAKGWCSFNLGGPSGMEVGGRLAAEDVLGVSGQHGETIPRPADLEIPRKGPSRQTTIHSFP